MEEKKKSNSKKTLTILLVFLVGIGVYCLYDEHRRKEAVRETQQRNFELRLAREKQEHSGGAPSKHSRQGSCTVCPCSVTRSWLEYYGYDYCPECSHPATYHNY